MSLKIFFPECLNNSIIEIEEAIDGLGSNDNGIDAYLVDEKSKIMHFFQFKTTDSWDKKTITPNDAAYFFDLEHRLNSQDTHKNKKIQNIIDDYKNNINKGYSAEFHFFTSYNLLNTNSLNRLYDKNKFYFYTLDDVYDKLQEYESISKDEPDNCELEFYTEDNNKVIPEWCFGKQEGVIRKTSIGIVTGFSLIELYTEYKKALFSRNVRNFLGDKGINKDIIYTAENKPENFYFYNNGITITCEKYEKRGKKLQLKKPQIINGAQTISSIYCAYENKNKDKTLSKDVIKNHFNRLLVMTRIIQTTKSDDSKFSTNVTKYNNTQNKILIQDFYANNNRQKRIYELLEKEGYFYEHKRGSSDLLSKEDRLKYKNKIIGIGDLTMIWNTFKNCDSGTTSKKSKLFEEEKFNEIFDDNSDNIDSIKKMIVAFNLYQILNDIKKSINYLSKNKIYSNKQSDYTLELNEILSEPQLMILKNHKFNDYSEDDCKRVIEQLEPLKYPYSIISIVGYIFKKIQDKINIIDYYKDYRLYEIIQKNMFRKIAIQIQKNFRKEDLLGNIIHYFKTDKVEKDFENYIKKEEINENKSVFELYELDKLI